MIARMCLEIIDHSRSLLVKQVNYIAIYISTLYEYCKPATDHLATYVCGKQRNVLQGYW